VYAWDMPARHRGVPPCKLDRVRNHTPGHVGRGGEFSQNRHLIPLTGSSVRPRFSRQGSALARENVEELELIGRDIKRVVLARAVKWHLEDRALVHENRTVVF
jgi:hypothetical protein